MDDSQTDLLWLKYHLRRQSEDPAGLGQCISDTKVECDDVSIKVNFKSTFHTLFTEWDV